MSIYMDVCCGGRVQASEGQSLTDGGVVLDAGEGHKTAQARVIGSARGDEDGEKTYRFLRTWWAARSVSARGLDVRSIPGEAVLWSGEGERRSRESV